jgi:PKD repeat protein
MNFKNNFIKIYGLVLILFLTGLTTATAQPTLQKSVVGAGAAQATGGGLRLSGTIGQTFIGPSQSTIARLNAGFWNRVDCDLTAEITGGTTLSTCSNPTLTLMGNSNQPDAGYSWTGPDGFSSDLQNPVISASGGYTLTVTAPDGCTATANVAVTEEAQATPAAGFNFVVDGIDVSFTDQSSFEPTSWFWDFGNGEVSTRQNPTFRYLTGGEYEVCLTAKNNCGETTICQTVSISTPEDAVTFLARPRTEAPTGVMLDIPISVQNFTNVASFQLSVHVGDPSIARIVGVEGFNLPDLDENDFFQIDDRTLVVAWYHGPGTTVQDLWAIFRVKVELLGQEESCTPIFIDNDPTFVEVGVLTPENTIISAPYDLMAGEICVVPFADVFGQIYRETQDPLKDVTVECTGQDAVVTGQDGAYQFAGLGTGSEYIIDPGRNTNPLEGVSAIDLALITRHIQTLELLNSPYKIIAADVDHSNTVGAIDLANIQQLILRKTTEFADVDSWRFVDAAFEFPDPAAPLTAPFPETIVVENLLQDISDADFIGIKLGDVNGTARGFNEPVVDDMAILIAEQNNGNVTRVEFRAADLQRISAYQFDINFDPAQMQLEEIIPGVLPGLNQTFFNTEKVVDGVISTLWYDPTGNPDGLQLDPDEVLFSLQFRVKPKANPIRERIWTGDRVLQSAGYTEKGEALRIGSVYEEDLREGLDHALRQIRLDPLSPNPFDERTNLSFYLPEAADVQIEVRDALGRMVKAIHGNYAQGNHQLRIESSELGGQGLYLVKMKSGDFMATRKVIFQRQ